MQAGDNKNLLYFPPRPQSAYPFLPTTENGECSHGILPPLARQAAGCSRISGRAGMQGHSHGLSTKSSEHPQTEGPDKPYHKHQACKKP